MAKARAEVFKVRLLTDKICMNGGRVRLASTHEVSRLVHQGQPDDRSGYSNGRIEVAPSGE